MFKLLFIVFMNNYLGYTESTVHYHNGKEWKHGDGEEQMAYTMSVTGCSAVLIHKDWLLSGTHCLRSPNPDDIIQEDRQGNKVISDAVLNSMIMNVPRGAIKKPKWGDPLQVKVRPADEPDSSEGWRKIEKIYTEDFKFGKLYKGNDLMLIKLAPEARVEHDGYIVPICLPDPEQADIENEETSLFFVGYGKRMPSRCVTNEMGPDKFHVCGHRQCDHQEAKCGMKFLYKGEYRYHCLKSPTPSAKNPVCQALLIQHGMKDFQEESYVFNEDGSLKTVCFPFYIRRNQKGWCGTKAPWETKFEEPKSTGGWGFCGGDEYQEFCDRFKDDVVDTRKYPVSQLGENFCFEMLRKNMKVELPQVPESEYNKLEEQDIICVGRNVSFDVAKYPAFQEVTENRYKKIKMNQAHLLSIKRDSIESFSATDGAACFGDSGGPLVKTKRVDGVDKPVLIGVMSFLLWGACKSRSDPSYYTRVSRYMDFITKHVPKEELCFA